MYATSPATTKETIQQLQSERDFQAAVLELATLTGWATFHVFDSRRSAPGWPDLILCRPPRLLVVELKSAHGRLSRAQR